MEVILKEDVPKLGNRGEIVKVAEGYGRNFLLPRKLAVEATQANKAVIEQMKAAAVRRGQRDKSDAEALASQLAPVVINLQRRAGEHDQLFGSVTASDIAGQLEHRGFNIDRRKIHLDEPIKTLGEFSVPIRLYRDVVPKIKVVVEKEAVEVAEEQ